MAIELVTSLEQAESDFYREHLSATLQELETRLGRPPHDRPFRLFLFRTPWEYKDFLRGHGLPWSGSCGVFFHTPEGEGIATFTRGFGVNRVLANLQHEAFHAFAYRLFGDNLPIWINEGLAQYFEDALKIDGRLRLGPCETRRLCLIQREAANVPLDEFVQVPAAGWTAMMQVEPHLAALSYAAAWSLVRFFLWRASPWRDAFANGLRALRRGESAEMVMHWLTEPRAMEAISATWQEWLRQVEPDNISLAMDRLFTLADVLKWMHAEKQRMPASIDEFRGRLRLMGVEFVVRSRGGQYLERVRGDALQLFADPGAEGAVLELTPGPTLRSPPVLRAAATPGQPTLTWTSSTPRELDWHIDFCGSTPAPQTP